MGQALDEDAIRKGFDRFKADKKHHVLADIAQRHGVGADALQAFVDGVLRRRIFDGEALSELMAPLDLGWKARTQKGAGVDGRTDAAAAQTSPRARHFGFECV